MNYVLPFKKQELFSARFLGRPNRFLVDCENEQHGTIRAFLPNPGRLSELLFPGVRLYVLDQTKGAENRKTKYTVIAVDRDKAPVMLHTHWCNDMAEVLLKDHAIPGLEDARVVRREAKVGRSRFDFLLEDASGLFYLEVKSCTLFGNGVAMFPDAVTERGRKHLLELASLSAEGFPCRVLFIVQTDKVQWFMPDYHTDLAFSQTLLHVKDQVKIDALPVSWTKSMRYKPGTQMLQIPWDHIEKEANDRGAYLLILKLPEDTTLSIGSLGDQNFKKGYYIYVGSAMANLTKRIERHGRKRKQKHWHIDYFRAACDVVDALPIRSSQRMECILADEVKAQFPENTNCFGCSDCRCESHLFYSQDNPLHQPAFHQWLQSRRMAPPQ